MIDRFSYKAMMVVGIDYVIFNENVDKLISIINLNSWLSGIRVMDG